MFVSCGEISNVLFKDNALILQTDKKYLADLIQEEGNILNIKRAARFLGYTFEVLIELFEGKNEKTNKDIAFLKSKLSKFLIVE